MASKNKIISKVIHFVKKNVLSILILGILLILVVFLRVRTKEGFDGAVSNPPPLPLDADTPTLTDLQIYGNIPSSSSISIYLKKEAQAFAAGIDSAPIDPTTGGVLFQQSTISLNTNPSDIEVILNAAAVAAAASITAATVVGNFTSAAAKSQAIQSQAQSAAQDKVTATVQDKVKETALKTKSGKAFTSYIMKNLTKVSTKMSAKLANRFGGSLAIKLMNKISAKIAESVGKKAAIASTQAGLLGSNPVTAAFGIMLGVISIVAISLQTYMTVTLKGEDGYCPTGWTILSSQVPGFLSSIPGIGDILGTMGPYLCYKNSCDANEDEEAALCYTKCDAGYHGMATVCWANSSTSSSSEPAKKGCAELNQGWARCRDDGTSLWEDFATWWNGCCSRGIFGECYGCLNSNGCGCIKKTLTDRQYCPDPTTELASITGGATIDRRCYKKCDPSTPYRVPGVPTQCTAARFVGVGTGGTSYDRGAGRPKLKMQPVTASPPPPPPPASTSSAAYSSTQAPACIANYSSAPLLKSMCDFYYNASKTAATKNAQGIMIFPFISKISSVVASSEQSCDVLCEMKTVTYNTNTGKATTSTLPTQGNDRRFYFAKITNICLFVPTACTNANNLAPDIKLPDPGPTTVSFIYTPPA